MFFSYSKYRLGQIRMVAKIDDHIIHHFLNCGVIASVHEQQSIHLVNAYQGLGGVRIVRILPGELLVDIPCLFILAYGIQADYIWNSIIEDCWFMDISTAAIHNPSVQGEPDYLVVKGCKFTSCVSAINLPDCEYVLIERNRFQQCGLAITMIAVDFTPYYNTIAHNTIQGAPAGVNNMINLTGGGNNLVCNNCLSCSIVQYDTTCSDSTSGSWGGNRCSNGDTTAAPT